MESPVDPIFWLHHANIDRLWVAWVAAGGGRAMPSRTSSYWSGNFIYSSFMAMQRLLTYDNRNSLGYYYQRETMPTTLPALTTATTLAAPGVAAPSVAAPETSQELVAQAPPAVATNTLSGPRATSPSTFSAAGALGVGLGERSASVQLPVPAEYGQAMAQVAAGNAATAPGSTALFRNVELVLDNVDVTEGGSNGGYYYKVYLNVPGTAGRVRSLPVDTLGPFKIAAAKHHHGGPAQLRFNVTRLLAGLTRTQLGMLTVSFVRVSGDNSPTGQVISIDEVRIELSTSSNGS